MGYDEISNRQNCEVQMQRDNSHRSNQERDFSNLSQRLYTKAKGERTEKPRISGKQSTVRKENNTTRARQAKGE